MFSRLLGKQVLVTPYDSGPPFVDYICSDCGGYYGTKSGIQLTPNLYEWVPTRNHIPLRKPKYEIKLIDADTIMTRREVIALLTSNDQVKVRHEYFSKDEWVKSTSIDGVIWLVDENEYYLPFDEFFQIRSGGSWETGWSIID